MQVARRSIRSEVTWQMVIMSLGLLWLVGVSVAYATEQKSWSVSFSDMKGGTNKTGGTVVTADGAEYKFQVTGSVPEGVTFRWEVLPNVGILPGETGTSLNYQAPISHEENIAVKVTAIFPPGPGAGEPYWAKWSVVIKEPFVDAYLYEADKKAEGYLPAPANPEDPAPQTTVYAFIGDGDTAKKPGMGIKVVPVHWSETHSGDAGSFSKTEQVSETQTDTDDAGEAQVTLWTSKQAGHYHNVTSTIKDKTGAESNADTSPNVTVVKVEILI